MSARRFANTTDCEVRRSPSILRTIGRANLNRQRRLHVIRSLELIAMVPGKLTTSRARPTAPRMRAIGSARKRNSVGVKDCLLVQSLELLSDASPEWVRSAVESHIT
jgi:hypothetical protein